MAQPTSSALRALALEYKSLQEEPVEGFRVKLVNEDNMFEWEVAIFGPPDTLYQGGYFKAHMKFPPDYPYSPPSIRFMTKVWHPNVYENGDLCISILHPPVDDPQSGELPCERWNPTQNVRKQAQAAKMEAEKEGIVVPVTLEDYCIKTRARPAEQQLDMTDFYDDEYELDDDEDEQLSASDYEDGDDSGNGES
ncbi:ubiquitin-conjugating enzyme E2 R2 isoform X4 [Vespula pensylvanica]|uniref:ubiquitin-conjugating enzyme E2 R2 isoform X4 n=1 Tax=Vespula pensylvanica TaxID=30213 RepID=UPI001CBA3F81|nr:ubiquitin-conjugating enzyme E2 R2 isoform X4 [Vespula pensylvanica]XP_050869250.1 ubiquitin-conjugating enzyme E2 R2 isoform X4 [Vespula vulgaris]